MEEKKEEHKHIKHKAQHPAKSTSKFNHYNWFLIIVGVLALVMLYNIIQVSSINQDIRRQQSEIEEQLRPGDITLTVITDSRCEDCFDLTEIVEVVKAQNVNIIEENNVDFQEPKAKNTITNNAIDRIPALVIEGEIDKINIEGLTRLDESLVFEALEPPYTDAESSLIEGRVTALKLIDPVCEDCYDIGTLLDQIKGAGVKVITERDVMISGSEGRNLIDKYGLDFVPTLVLSKDAEIYDIIEENWPNIGTQEDDGRYVLRTTYAPFINLTTGTLEGLVDIIYLTDNSCEECYDVSLHKQILENPRSFNVKLNSEKTVDVSDAEGQELVDQYEISLVPTTIITSEITKYTAITTLSRFFSQEEDGTFVFRSVANLGTYKNLETGEVTNPREQSQEQ